MSRAGCSRAPLLVGIALLLGLVGAPAAGLALQPDQDAALAGYGLASVEGQNAPRFPSTVTLTADRTRALVGQDVTLTARTNVAIPDNPNVFINIRELDTSYRPFSYACKGAVSVCTVTVSSKQFDGGRPIRFVGQVWNTYTGFVISSDPVTVTWTSPPPAAAKPTATPTRTPTPSPTATATATPDVCSPPLRTVRDSAPATSLTLFSTPKDQAAYRVDVPLPRSDEFASRRGPSADLRRLAARAGEIELTARYVDRAGAQQAISWRAPLKSLLACSDADEQRRAMDGEATLVSGQGQGREYLVLRYRALDELERITRDVAADAAGLAPGEEATRGAEYRFPIEVVFHDDGGELARSSAGWRSLDYVVREPVVFVPGTAGSRLAVDGAEVWPANVPSASDRAYWQRLALDEAGNGPTVRATDVFREYGKGALCNAASQRGCVYKRWIAHMDAAGYAENQGLFLLPYDWRVPVERHVGELDAVVDRALARNYSRRAADAAAAPGAPPTDRKPTDRVVLIGHSQGGLIVRDYAADAARAAKVSAVVQLGAPNQGTLKVYRALATTGYTFEAPFMAAEIGKWLARDWPSAYDQLLVGRDGRVPPFLFEADGRPVADFRAILLNPRTHLFCQTGQTDPRCRIQTLSSALLDRAEASHARPPRAPASGVPFYTVLSTDQPTIVGFRRALRAAPVPSSKNLPSGGQSVGYDDARRLGILPPDAIAALAYVLAETPSGTVLHVPVYEEVTRACGDNLVPVHSGVLEGASMLYVHGVAHGGYTDDPHVQSLIDRILRGVRPAGEPAPACLANGGSLPQATGEGTSIVAAGSPANLHVYDAQGRHTGLRADDTAETGIPGSAFDQDGGMQQVWLPRADQAVRVELEGLIDATVDLRITTWNGASERRVEYAGLPETARMRASLGVA
ncbi:MAG TPA: hypothetical protein VG370_04320, partial [Chloroflexota bacterium]|nr:hypothetical protein [Chloroflexota bacterium]